MMTVSMRINGFRVPGLGFRVPGLGFRDRRTGIMPIIIMGLTLAAEENPVIDAGMAVVTGA